MLTLGFHRVEPFTGFEITRLSPRRFSRILEFLMESGTPIIAPESHAVEAGILLTFDDAYQSIAEYALPALAARNLSAAVFVIAGSVGRTDDWDVRTLGRPRPMMSWQELRHWSDRGVAIGSHTMSHTDLTILSPRALREELKASRCLIEDRIGHTVRWLSYPFGRHNAWVRDAVDEAGYKMAFATSHFVRQQPSPLALPRVLVNALTSLLELDSLLEEYRRDGVQNEQWRGHWRNHFLSSLSVGSAAVTAWRRRAQGTEPEHTWQEGEQIVPLPSRWS